MSYTMSRHGRWWIGLGVALALLGSACNAGGGGGPVPGSDEDTKQQQDKVSKGARADLDAALKAVQPCSSDIKQIQNVMNPYGRLQQVGTSTDADDRRVRDTVAPAVRAVARAFTRGENVGLDQKGVDALVKAAGIDDSADAWMEDDKCEQNWSVVYILSAPQVGNGGLLVEGGTIPITVSTAGAVSGSGGAAIKFTLKPIGPCDFSEANSATTMSIGGTLKGGTFSLLLSRGAYTLATQSTCHLPAPVGDITIPTPVPMQPFDAFPMSVAAKAGATAETPLLAGASISVTMLRRR